MSILTLVGGRGGRDILIMKNQVSLGPSSSSLPSSSSPPTPQTNCFSMIVVVMEFSPKVMKNVLYPPCTQCLVEKGIEKKSKSIALSKAQLSDVRLLVLVEKGHKNLACIYQQKINYMHFLFIFFYLFFHVVYFVIICFEKSFLVHELWTFNFLYYFHVWKQKSGLSCFRQSKQSYEGKLLQLVETFWTMIEQTCDGRPIPILSSQLWKPWIFWSQMKEQANQNDRHKILKLQIQLNSMYKTKLSERKVNFVWTFKVQTV